MSVSSGTATNYTDLLARLVTFLTTDSALVAAGQNWAQLASSSTSYSYTEVATATVSTVDQEVYLKAPGLSGTEAIYVNIQAFHNPSVGYYNLRLRGATGYNSGTDWFHQPGASPDAFVHLWTNTIPYTFIANGQRVIVIAQVGTVYESAYLGKFLPYGQPGQYPYPVAIGGTSINPVITYADTTPGHSAFFDPTTLWIYWVDGTWQQFQNFDSNGTQHTIENIWPFMNRNGAGTPAQPTWLTTDLDGGYPIAPCRIEMTTPAANILGEFDGVGFIPGIAQSTGSTITVGSATYMALQNVFRTGNNNFAAVLEA